MKLTEDLQPVADTLRMWASEETLVRRLWIYGSRARGTGSPHSDLDIAVEIHVAGDNEDSYTVFVCEAEDWRSKLDPRLVPYTLDLKLYDTSGAREKVRRGVDADGILIYERTIQRTA